MTRLGFIAAFGLVCCACGQAGDAQEDTDAVQMGLGGLTGFCSFQQGAGGLGGGSNAELVTFRQGALVYGEPYTTMADTMIIKADLEGNYDTDTVCGVKGGAAERSCLMLFDTRPISGRFLTRRTVKHACLVLNVEDPSVRHFDLFEITRPWLAPKASWKWAYTGAMWNTPGTKSEADRVQTPVGLLPDHAPVGSISIDFDTALVQRWLDDPGFNMGFVIANEVGNDGISLSSSAASDINLRPALKVWLNPR